MDSTSRLMTATEPAVTLWNRDSEQVITTDLVLGETWTLARMRGVAHPHAMALIDAVNASSRVEVVTVDKGHAPAGVGLAADSRRTRLLIR